jgi:hypothetical protein
VVRHFIAFAGPFSATPLHELVEGLEIRPCFSILKVPGSFGGGNPLRHGMATLVDAGSVFTLYPTFDTN